MNKRYLTQVFLFFTIIITLLGCTKKNTDNICLSFAKAPVTKVEGPITALVNQEIILTVSFSCFNGCGQFGNFDEAINGNLTTISVNAKYEGCICTQDIPTRQTTYKFKKSQKGSFDLKFLQTDNTFLTYTIIVQ
jgi:hypothetical protein